jgi:hypothetical protein
MVMCDSCLMNIGDNGIITVEFRDDEFYDREYFCSHQCLVRRYE